MFRPLGAVFRAVCLLALLAVALPHGSARAAGPTLTLDPARGRCRPDDAITVRGAGFAPGLALDIDEHKPNERVGGRLASATVGVDGTFAVAVPVRTWCGGGPEGERYIFSAVAAGQGYGAALAEAVFTIDSSPPPVAPGERRCFAETGRCVAGGFLAYWRFNGGLALNGLPLTDEFEQRLEDGRMYRVQYFERVRLEYHPGNAAPYDVLLGQFGRRIHPADPSVPMLYPTGNEPIGYNPAYFSATGHNLRGAFRVFFDANGGIPQFGLPISEEFRERQEDGNEYIVQYFERARFEYHPEHVGTPDEIQLGQFGRRILAETQGGR